MLQTFELRRACFFHAIQALDRIIGWAVANRISGASRLKA
jgi:hypothetical protein